MKTLKEMVFKNEKYQEFKLWANIYKVEQVVTVTIFENVVMATVMISNLKNLLEDAIANSGVVIESLYDNNIIEIEIEQSMQKMDNISHSELNVMVSCEEDYIINVDEIAVEVQYQLDVLMNDFNEFILYLRYL